MTPEIFSALSVGQAVPMINIFPALGRLPKRSLLPIIQPDVDRFGVWQEWKYVWANLVPSVKTDVAQQLMTVIVVQMPKSVAGTIYWTRHPVLGGSWFLPDTMESIEFNNGLKVMASNRALAQSVLSPDFMAWILDHNQPDMFFFREQYCIFWFAADEQPDVILSSLHAILHYVKHSGALDATPESK